MNLWWNSLGPENKLFYGIVFINACVFAAWKVPSWRGFMVANFYANPFARTYIILFYRFRTINLFLLFIFYSGAVCWPMVLSTFSHSSILHFGINMFVLQSFMHGMPIKKTMSLKKVNSLHLIFVYSCFGFSYGERTVFSILLVCRSCIFTWQSHIQGTYTLTRLFSWSCE